MGENNTICTLTDSELVYECEKWIDRLCKSGGDAQVLEVPVNMNRDPDMLFTELIQRFHKSKAEIIRQALVIALFAPKRCYDVNEYPADGNTEQDSAIKIGEEALVEWSRKKEGDNE